MTRYGTARYGTARHGLVGYGTAQHGAVWYGTARHGEWIGSIRVALHRNLLLGSISDRVNGAERSDRVRTERPGDGQRVKVAEYNAVGDRLLIT